MIQCNLFIGSYGAKRLGGLPTCTSYHHSVKSVAISKSYFLKKKKNSCLCLTCVKLMSHSNLEWLAGCRAAATARETNSSLKQS